MDQRSTTYVVSVIHLFTPRAFLTPPLPGNHFNPAWEGDCGLSAEITRNKTRNLAAEAPETCESHLFLFVY